MIQRTESITFHDDAVDPGQVISAEDRARAELYNLLAVLLSRPPSGETLDALKTLQGDSETEIGKGVSALASLSGKLRTKAVEKEFNALFIGLGRGELLPYASYYMTGFLNEKPLARLRRDMRGLGIGRAETVREPEDNIATLCEIMAGLITGAFGAAAPLDQQNEFFRIHIGPWAGHFFSDLEAAQSSVFYAPVGTIGRALIEVESEAFRIDK
ncbi:MAG: molecular chaperone TorD family protein [Paracoccaceae bacterium]